METFTEVIKAVTPNYPRDYRTDLAGSPVNLEAASTPVPPRLDCP